MASFFIASNTHHGFYAYQSCFSNNKPRFSRLLLSFPATRPTQKKFLLHIARTYCMYILSKSLWFTVTFYRPKSSYISQNLRHNRPSPCYPKCLFQNEVKCSTFDMKMIFYCRANKIHFHKKRFALSLVLIV